MASQVARGKAFEFCIIKKLGNLLAINHQHFYEKEDAAYNTAQKYFNELDPDDRTEFGKAAQKAVEFLLNTEPRLFQSSPSDQISLRIASDSEGQKGDVRDIIIAREAINWEIGISAKSNHWAVKHPRLSGSIDFGKEWLDIQCSKEYFNDINPLFAELEEMKVAGKEWNELGDRHRKFYLPLLFFFRKEILKIDKANPGLVPKRVVEYLVGRGDFYKVIRSLGKVEIHVFNLGGSLNLAAGKVKPKANIQKLKLPERIVELDFKPGSYSTLLLFLDEGWQISFRIHSASSRVEASLKFDINLLSTPSNLFSQHIYF